MQTTARELVGKKMFNEATHMVSHTLWQRVADGIYYLAIVYDDDALRNLVANILVHNGSAMGSGNGPAKK